MEATTTKYSPRPYQADALDAVENLYHKGARRQLAVAATGVGKTIFAAFLPHQFPELMEDGLLFLAHKEELVWQARDTFQKVNPSLTVGVEKAEYRSSRDADIVIASIPTIGRTGSGRINKFAGRFGIVVVDEAHHASPAPGIYDRTLSFFGVGSDVARQIDGYEIGASHTRNGRERLSIGLSATPSRNDGVGLNHFYDEIPFNYDIRWAVDQGWLVDIQAQRVSTDVDISEVSSHSGDFTQSELQEAVNLHSRNEVIISAYKQHGQGQAIAYCAGVDHAHDLAASFRAWDIEAYAIDGETEDEERRRLVGAFREGEIDVLTNFGIFLEGSDFPRLKTILMARPTKSQQLYVQVIGRALRPWPALDLGSMTRKERVQAIQHSPKPVARVIDFTDNSSKHPVVTLPSLYGLREDFDTDGKPIFETLDEIEERERENPSKSLKNAKSLEEIETLVETVDVWDLTSPDATPDDLSDFRWFQLGEDKYQLEVPAGSRDADSKWFNADGVPSQEMRDFYIQVKKNSLGKWGVSMHWPQEYDGKTFKPEKNQEGETSKATHTEAIEAVDDWVAGKFSDVSSLMQHSPGWGTKPASDGQINYLKRLGVQMSRNDSGDIIDLHSGDKLTKGKASALISAKKQMS